MTVETVIKRNGTIERFQSQKIIHALEKAHAHAHGRNKETEKVWMQEVALKVHKLRPRQLSSDVIRKVVVDELKTRKMKAVADHYDYSFLQDSKSPLKKVIKRDGRTQEFSPKKIYKSVRKAFTMVSVHHERECERVTKMIVKRLEKMAGRKPIPIEAIREATEEVLEQTGYQTVAHRYMLHRYM